jgi:hypothetical protein
MVSTKGHGQASPFKYRVGQFGVAVVDLRSKGDGAANGGYTAQWAFNGAPPS